MCRNITPHTLSSVHPYTLASFYMQDRDIVRFDPALLPVQPNAAVVNISYGFPNISSEEFNPERSINITIDTPYNIRDVSVCIMCVCMCVCVGVCGYFGSIEEGTYIHMHTQFACTTHRQGLISSYNL